MNKAVKYILNIFITIISVILIIVGLAFIFIEGRLLFSLDWIVYNSPISGFLMYFSRLLIALFITVIGILEIVNMFKKNNILFIVLLFGDGAAIIISILLAVMAANYVNIVALILGILIFIVKSIVVIINKDKLLLIGKR